MRDKQSGLTRASTANAVVAEIRAIEAADHWQVLAFVVMPDHLHLFVRLGESLSLDRVIARLKTKTRAALSSAALAWQVNYYEHRLRPDDPFEPVVRYVYLNPYRANLLEPVDSWPWFALGTEVAQWFVPTLNGGTPFMEWLK